jgi:L-alanine-DL-glutamate epimerase-like enolase superfamily enzyme
MMFKLKTTVEIQTVQGLSGFGESCAIGSVYLPACAESARAGIEVVVPHLIGKDPRQTACINHLMDVSLKDERLINIFLYRQDFRIKEQPDGMRKAQQ